MAIASRLLAILSEAAFGAGAPSLALSDAACDAAFFKGFSVAFGFALSSFSRSRFFCLAALMGKALKGIVVSE